MLNNIYYAKVCALSMGDYVDLLAAKIYKNITDIFTLSTRLPMKTLFIRPLFLFSLAAVSM